jgi:hypothetical protein
LRAVAVLGVLMVDVVGIVAMVGVVARLGAVAGKDGRRRECYQPENAYPHQARGSQVFTKHEIPVPVSDLITGS